MVHDGGRPDTGSPMVAPGLRFLVPLVSVTAAGPVAMQMFLPALPAMRTEFAASQAVAQMTISLALLTFGFAMLAYGPASDRLGRRGPLIVATALYLIGNVLCALAPGMEMLILGRIVNALGGAGGMVLTRAMVRDVYPADRVAGAMSQLTVGQVVLPMLAPAAGGLLTEAFGWRMNFLVLIVLGLVNLVLVWRLPETHTARSAGHGLAGMVGSFWSLLRRPRFDAYAAFATAGIGAYFAFIAGAPFVAVGVLGMSAAEYGVAFVAVSASFMIGNLVSARVSHRLGVDRMVMLGGAIAIVGTGCGLTLALGGVWGAVALFAPAAVMAFGNGLSLNNAQAGAMAVDGRIAGAAAGLTGFLQMMCGAVVTQAVGAVHDHTPLPVVAMMAASAASALFLYGLFRRVETRGT